MLPVAATAPCVRVTNSHWRGASNLFGSDFETLSFPQRAVLCRSCVDPSEAEELCFEIFFETLGRALAAKP